MAKIDVLFKELINRKGSDLHLKEGQKPKIRLYGHLHDLEEYKVLTPEIITTLLKEIIHKDIWDEFDQRGDIDFAYTYDVEAARFRANYFKHSGGIGGIFRIIPSKIPSIEDLGLPSSLRNFAHTPSGLILITGPTGSGKSSTLAAIIDHINIIKSQKIITIEEPVEFMHTNKKSIISHREVGPDTPSFAQGLKSALKSDPNIILVGEMRDQETIELALLAAQMGMLVFSTLHTNSAAQTIDRIIDAFPSKKKRQIRTNLAATLQSVVSQQLLRSMEGNRRWVAYELLLKTPAVSALIYSGETNRIPSEIQTNAVKGMISLDECLKRLYKEKKVSYEAAHMKALDKVSFRKSIEEMEPRRPGT